MVGLENLEVPEDDWHSAQDLKYALSEYKSRSSHCTNSAGIKYLYI